RLQRVGARIVPRGSRRAAREPHRAQPARGRRDRHPRAPAPQLRRARPGGRLRRPPPPPPSLSAPRMSKSPKIAVVGVACLFPGSSDLEGYWRDILARRDRIGPVPRTHWLVEDYYDPDPKAPDKIYVDRGGFLDPIAFDPMKWGVPPSILPATDTT